MIPITLQLKNFLSYGSDLQTIDFSTYNLICFSGKNGHGKSALLDAITWAIWGYARKTLGAAKADQGLLRLGQTQMMVCLDFYCNGAQYRVRRELTIRHNKPVAALDFGITQEDGTLISLTDKTIRTTQNKIEKTINLDFESFCNSAFLRQGQSNEFCKKSPKDRKEILTRILGLQQYETIRRLAMDKAKKALLEKQQLALLQENIETEIASENKLHEQKKELSNALNSSEKEITETEQIFTKKQAQQKELFTQKNKYAIDLFALDQTQKQVSLLQNQLLSIRHQWRLTHKQRCLLSSSKELEEHLDKLKKECSHYQSTFQKCLKLKELFLQKKSELHTIESEWRTQFYQELQKEKNHANQLLLEQKRSETDATHFATKYKELGAHKASLENELKTIAYSIKEIQQLKGSFEKNQQLFDKRKEAYQRYRTEGSLRSTQLKELKQKQLLACKTEAASCPLCEQTVTASRRRFLDNKFIQEEKQINHKIARLARLIGKLKPIIVEQHKQLEPLQKKIHEESTLENRHKELSIKHEIARKEIQAIHTQLEGLQKKTGTISETLNKQQAHITLLEKNEKIGLQDHALFKEIKECMTRCEKKAKELQYNAAKHKEKEDTKQKLEQQLKQYKQISEQLPLQNERKKQITDVCNQLRNLKKQESSLRQKTKEAHNIEAMIGTIQKEQEAHEMQLKDLQRTKEQLLQQKGSLESQFKKLDLYKQKHKTVLSSITEKMTTYQEFTTIAHAMSKDGIQALLIEDVIPEIEYEANELLARLTHNQSQIIIESVKDLKSGGTRETLDIFISDALGLRPYELFSGGEAFRIDFALRIAISKLVARRSGTSLQTLIIDEGFGSQDEEGLALMMEALHKIQDDFEKIIVVSHLPFMKDHFPVHFMIEKGPMGSNVTVLQQG